MRWIMGKIVRRRRTSAADEEIPRKKVTKIISFKRDFFAVDQIAFKFLWKDGASLVVIEDMSGWKELLQTLPKRLPGFPAEREWFQKVAPPPFAANDTVLYERTTRP